MAANGLPVCSGGNGFLHALYFFLDGRGISDPAVFACMGSRATALLANALGQPVDSLPTGCRHGNDRHAEQSGELLCVHADAPALRFVHKVDADNDVPRQLRRFQHKGNSTPQTARVAHDDRRIRPSGAEECRSRFLLRRMRREGIHARNVHHAEFSSLPQKASLGCCHRLSRPVARVLVKTCQAVEDRAFADVGIPREGNDRFSLPVRFFLAAQTGFNDFPDKTHISSP